MLSAWSKQPDFDAKSYVQSSLDAYYHGDHKDYANLLEISEKDAKKEIEEDFNESIQQQFDDSDNITDKGIADYAKKLAEVKKLAKYRMWKKRMEVATLEKAIYLSMKNDVAYGWFSEEKQGGGCKNVSLWIWRRKAARVRQGREQDGTAEAIISAITIAK